MQKIEIDYNRCITDNIEMALRRLQKKPDVSDSRGSLLSLLLSKGNVFHLPNDVLPKGLRRKHIVCNTEVAVGKHGGLLLKKELGRGAFGRVVLMNTSNNRQSSNIAIKVQSPTDSLAWEYIVLQRLEQRLIPDRKQDIDYAYPRPISFISLADGGIMSMSAASETGLNLVDLSNFYKLKLGKPVPELIALHYTSIALRIIEQLHWHGKILVCSPMHHCSLKMYNIILTFFSSLFFSIVMSNQITLCYPPSRVPRPVFTKSISLISLWLTSGMQSILNKILILLKNVLEIQCFTAIQLKRKCNASQ